MRSLPSRATVLAAAAWLSNRCRALRPAWRWKGPPAGRRSWWRRSSRRWARPSATRPG